MTRATRSPAAVHFEIGRVTLHGYSAPEQRRFMRSLEASLSDLGESRAAQWPAGGRRTIASLDAGTVRSGASPEEAAGLVVTALRARIAAQPARGGQP